jgi:acetyl esterase/lipase
LQNLALNLKNNFRSLHSKALCWLYKRWYLYRFGVNRAVGAGQIKITKDIAYLNNDHPQNKLDIYSPVVKPEQPLPVIFYVPGGGWVLDNRDDPPTNVQRNFCLSLAQENFVVISVSHRLSPEVQFPDHVCDTVKALAWVKQNIEAYGGNFNKLFLAGYSSGAQVATLMSLCNTYLKQAGFQKNCFNATIAVSGVYNIVGFAQDQFCKELMVKPTFGNDPTTWEKASPTQYAENAELPFCLLAAHHEAANLQAETIEMYEKLKQASKNNTELHIIPESTHFNILVPSKSNPIILLIKNFVNKYV